MLHAGHLTLEQCRLIEVPGTKFALLCQGLRGDWSVLSSVAVVLNPKSCGLLGFIFHDHSRKMHGFFPRYSNEIGPFFNETSLVVPCFIQQTNQKPNQPTNQLTKPNQTHRFSLSQPTNPQCPDHPRRRVPGGSGHRRTSLGWCLGFAGATRLMLSPPFGGCGSSHVD